MLLSMTGFGKGEASLADGTLLHAEISSVNRKQLEIRFTLPPEMAEWENMGRKIVSSWISRGAVQVRVTLSSPPAIGNLLDPVLLDSLIRECAAARSRCGVSGDVAVESLLAIPGVIRKTAGSDPEKTAHLLETALSAAGERYRAMREAEGAVLKQDLEARLKHLEELHARLTLLVAGQPAAAKQRLLARFETEKFPVSPDDPALMKELLFYIDKGDVTEELTRLTSHFGQFHRFLEASEPVGRSLDFLAQELFREITTLGNKAFASGVSPLVVEFKAEMEKIREQIQNIE